MTDTFLAESGGFEALRQTLVQAVARWPRDAQDVQTPIANLGLFRRTTPPQLDYCTVGPSLFVVVQGSKRTLFGQEAFTYDIHSFLVTSLDLPAMMHIVEADEERPYRGLMLRLDLRVVSEVILQSGFAAPTDKAGEPGISLGRTSPALLRALVRLASLLDEPESIPLLAPLIEREIYYRLIASDQSARLWQVTAVDSKVHHIARGVDWIRHNYRLPAGGGTGRLGEDEPLDLPPALQADHRDEPAAVTQVAAPGRGAPADAVGAPRRIELGLCRQLREPVAVQPRVRPHVRRIAEAGYRGVQARGQEGQAIA